MYDMIAPKSNVTARDILKEAMNRVAHPDQLNLFDAIQLSEEMQKRFGLWVRPEYLLEVEP